MGGAKFDYYEWSGSSCSGSKGAVEHPNTVFGTCWKSILNYQVDCGSCGVDDYWDCTCSNANCNGSSCSMMWGSGKKALTIIIIIVVVSIVLCICGGIACCYCGKVCCFKENTPAMAAGPQVVMQQPMGVQPGAVAAPQQAAP